MRGGDPNLLDVTGVDVVHVVITRSAGPTMEVLLLRRCNTGRGDGSWDCPAGRAEPGESLVAAAARELMEEVGLVAQPSDLAEAYREEGPGASGPVRHVSFVASRWMGEAANLEPERADRLDWFRPDSLPSPMLPFVAAGLRMSLST